MFKKKKAEVEVRKIHTEVAEIPIVGTGTLIVNKFANKAIEMIKGTQTGTTDKTKKRALKVPFDDFCESLHVIPGAKLPPKKLGAWEEWPYKPDTFGFPASGFKLGICAAARDTELSSYLAKGGIHVIGDLVPLKYKRLIMREDMVKVGWPKKADIRYRGEFTDWSAVVQVRYDASVITRDQIANLLMTAGHYSGLGENRPSSPEKPGPHGTYKIKGA